MSITKSYTKTTPDWEGLLAACQENEAVLPDVLAERRDLGLCLDKARALKKLQNSYAAARQETTQRLRQVLAEGGELAERLRDAVRFKLGRRNERLVQFRVAPLRKPGRKTKSKD